MAKQKVYLDSTVPSAYYDSRTPERQGQTFSFGNYFYQIMRLLFQALSC